MRHSIAITFMDRHDLIIDEEKVEPSDEDMLAVADAIEAAQSVLRRAGYQSGRTAHSYEQPARWKLWSEPAVSRFQIEARREDRDDA